jgi:hypothetical protein
MRLMRGVWERRPMIYSLARRAVWAMWGGTPQGFEKKRPAKAHIGIRSPYMVHEVVDVLSHSQGCPEAGTAWYGMCTVGLYH